MSAEAVVSPDAGDDDRATGPDTDWRRLDRRTVLVSALVTVGVAAGAAAPTTLGLSGRFGLGHAVAWVLAGALLLIGSAAAA